jgi:hypothetical protein
MKKKRDAPRRKRVGEPCMQDKRVPEKTIHDSHCTIAFLEETKKPAITARQG